jgi:hypothetical protein
LLLKHGSLQQLSSGSLSRPRLRKLYLFNDVLLYGKDSAAGFVILASVPALLLVVHEVIVEGSGTAFVIGTSSSNTGITAATTASSSRSDRHLVAPIGHLHTQGYFHKYVAFFSFDAQETRDWIAAIRACVRDAEWEKEEDIREQQQQQYTMISHDVSLPPPPPAHASSISISIPTLSSSDRIAAMVRGCQMFKFGFSRGNLEQRLVQLSSDHSELTWGEKRRSRVLMMDVRGVRYGAGSLAFFTAASKQLFNFDWLCFSVVTRTRTIDLCAKNFHEVVNFVMGMQALLQQQPPAAAADATLYITCDHLEARLREMLGERKPAAASASASASSSPSSRTKRRSASNSSEVRAFALRLLQPPPPPPPTTTTSLHPDVIQVSSPLFRRKSFAEPSSPAADVPANPSALEGATLLLLLLLLLRMFPQRHPHLYYHHQEQLLRQHHLRPLLTRLSSGDLFRL